jgi:hypothetical protein
MIKKNINVNVRIDLCHLSYATRFQKIYFP